MTLDAWLAAVDARIYTVQSMLDTWPDDHDGHWSLSRDRAQLVHDDLATLLALMRRAVEGLRKISDEVDHIGRDHAFDACNEIAEGTLADLTRLTREGKQR